MLKIYSKILQKLVNNLKILFVRELSKRGNNLNKVHLIDINAAPQQRISLPHEKVLLKTIKIINTITRIKNY